MLVPLLVLGVEVVGLRDFWCSRVPVGSLQWGFEAV